MRRHKTGCAIGCRCPVCSPRSSRRPFGPTGPGASASPTGPTGSRGPNAAGPTGFGVTGPTGPCCTGATGPGGGGAGTSARALLDFSGLVTIAAQTIITPVLELGYLANRGVRTGAIQALTLAPNYPAGESPITFDDLAVLVKSALLVAPSILPAGTELLIELVRNGTGPTGLAVVFIPGPGGLIIPIAQFLPGTSLQGESETVVTILPGETYDLRVRLNAVTGGPIIIPTPLALQISATLRGAQA